MGRGRGKGSSAGRAGARQGESGLGGRAAARGMKGSWTTGDGRLRPMATGGGGRVVKRPELGGGERTGRGGAGRVEQGGARGGAVSSARAAPAVSHSSMDSSPPPAPAPSLWLIHPVLCASVTASDCPAYQPTDHSRLPNNIPCHTIPFHSRRRRRTRLLGVAQCRAAWNISS